MTENLKSKIELYLACVLILVIFFGTIWISAQLIGVNLISYFPEFSWNMVNVKEMKQIFGV